MSLRRLAITIFALTVCGWGFAAAGHGLYQAVLLQLTGKPVPASSGVLAEHELEEIDAMAPQQQAMRLLERAINHYDGAGEEIAKRIEGWNGQIRSTPELENLTNTAYFSSDLRVRAAALEIWLARDGFRKTPETVDEVIHDAAVAPDPNRKYFLVSNLGILGNRGVEPENVFNTLTIYLHDPDPAARSAAINGLGLLGTQETIAPLLEILHSDPSLDLRDRAACNLADSGMLTRELRQKAVPELIRFSQDPALDPTARKWVFQALREITSQNLKDEATAWVGWYGAQAGR
jgi:hypothetical protein